MVRNTTILFCCRTDHLIFPVIKKRIFLMKYFVAYKKVSRSVRPPPCWIYSCFRHMKSNRSFTENRRRKNIDENRCKQINNQESRDLRTGNAPEKSGKKCIERILGKKIRDIISSETPSGVSRTVRALLRRSSPSEARGCE